MSEGGNSVSKAFLWSGIDNVLVQAIGFVVSILMARELLPSDYGTVGMLTIFTAISMSFIDGGFSRALIQYKYRTNTDMSTVFYVNLAMGLFFYLVLFSCSPLIADFFNTPILTDITRAISLTLIINSLYLVQRTKLTIDLNFKAIALANMVAGIGGGFVGLSLVYLDYGVWSIVWMRISTSFFTLVVTWLQSKWKPLITFSVSSFKRLFNYGSKLLITGLYGPIFENLSSVIIGKKWSAADLGFYTKANTLAQLPASNITVMINRVSFPVLSQVQDEDELLRYKYQTLIRVTYTIVSPLLLILIVIAKPLFVLLLTEKWLPAVPYFQILCGSGLFYAICAYNINIILVKGKSTLHLYLDIIKKIVGLVLLLIAVQFDILAICLSTIVSGAFSWSLTACFSRNLIGLSMKQQIKDVFRPLLIAITPALLVSFVGNYVSNDVLQMSLQAIVYFLIYIILSWMLNKDSSRILLSSIKSLTKKK